MTHIRKNRALALATGVLLLIAAPQARGDVRVDDPGAPEPGLAILLSPAGPWSLVGPFDSTVLNPAGDMLGDGLPDDAAQGEKLLAAWVRPGEGRLHLSRWSVDRWEPLPPFEARNGIGTPRVDPLGTGWALTWQQDDLEPVIRAAGVGLDGRHDDSEPIIRGWLVDHSWLDDVQLVLHWDSDRNRLYLTGVLWSVPGVPSPVDIIFQTEIRDVLSAGSENLPPPIVTPAEKPGNDGLGTAKRGAWSRRAVVSWWDESGELHQTVVDAQGDSRELSKPRFEPGLSMTPVGTPR